MMSASRHAAIVLCIAAGLAAVRCSGELTPPDQEAAAQQAMCDKDYDRALELFQGILNRQAVDVFIRLEDDFPLQMQDPRALRHALAIVGVLTGRALAQPVRIHLGSGGDCGASEVPKKYNQAIRLLEHARTRWPDKKHRIDALIEELKEKTRRETPREEKLIAGIGSCLRHRPRRRGRADP